MKEPKTIVTKLKFIKNALQRPYHTLTYSQNEICILTVENRKGEKFSWTGAYIAEVIENAMDYVRHEIEMGAIKEPK